MTRHYVHLDTILVRFVNQGQRSKLRGDVDILYHQRAGANVHTTHNLKDSHWLVVCWVLCDKVVGVTDLGNGFLTTFRVSRRWREIYIGHTCLSVCLSVLHHMPTLLHGPRCNSGERYRVPSSCAVLGGFAWICNQCTRFVAIIAQRGTRNVSEC